MASRAVLFAFGADAPVMIGAPRGGRSGEDGGVGMGSGRAATCFRVRCALDGAWSRSAGEAPGRYADSVVATFEAFPGPAQVSYGENIAYRATLDNQRADAYEGQVPAVASRRGVGGGPVASSCPTGAATTTLNADGSPKDWVCDFGQRPASAKLALTVVWQVPPTLGRRATARPASRRPSLERQGRGRTTSTTRTTSSARRP